MTKKSIEKRVLWPGDVESIEDAFAFFEEAKARHGIFLRHLYSSPLYRHTKHEPPLKAFYK